MKIILVSQEYGFCPTSQAFIIAREFGKARTNIDVSIVKSNSVELFSQLNKDTGIKVIEAIPSNTDLVISCYEPSAILEATLKSA